MNLTGLYALAVMRRYKVAIDCNQIKFDVY